MADESGYSEEPRNRAAFTRSHDRLYTRIANLCDTVKTLPVWKGWLVRAIPHIQDLRVLQVSFGTGYLLTQYAADCENYGIDYKRKVVREAAYWRGPCSVIQAATSVLDWRPSFLRMSRTWVATVCSESVSSAAT